jgi:hypothetical protein
MSQAVRSGAGSSPGVGAEERMALAFRDGVDQRGFTAVPNVVLEDARLEPGARLAYALLARLATANPGAEITPASLGALLGQSPRQARDHLRALVEAGLLGIASRRPDGQPAAFCLEPLGRRYGAARAAAAPPARGREIFPERGAAPEARGAVIPIMTEQRRAFEDRLAARIPARPPARTIGEAERELGRQRARALREQLLQAPPAPAGDASAGAVPAVPAAPAAPAAG